MEMCVFKHLLRAALEQGSLGEIYFWILTSQFCFPILLTYLPSVVVTASINITRIRNYFNCCHASKFCLVCKVDHSNARPRIAGGGDGWAEGDSWQGVALHLGVCLLCLQSHSLLAVLHASFNVLALVPLSTESGHVSSKSCLRFTSHSRCCATICFWSSFWVSCELYATGTDQNWVHPTISTPVTTSPLCFHCLHFVVTNRGLVNMHIGLNWLWTWGWTSASIRSGNFWSFKWLSVAVKHPVVWS
jgi:hypothetical protein